MLDTTKSFSLALMICAGVTVVGALAYLLLVRKPITDGCKTGFLLNAFSGCAGYAHPFFIRPPHLFQPPRYPLILDLIR